MQVGIEAGGYANYREAFKAFGSGFMRSHWRSFCASIQKLVKTPPDSELWFDVADIAAIQDAETDKSTAAKTKAEAMSQLIMAGYEPDSVTNAVIGDDLTITVLR